jgi:DNA-binding response OmpR family regulator
MPASAPHSDIGLQVAVRGVGLGPVPGVILGPTVGRGPLRRPGVVLAVRSTWTDEWTPFVASPRQILMTWERWCALRRDALTDHPWPTEAIRRLVEVLPQGTRRVTSGGPIGERLALVIDPSPSLQFIANTLLGIPGFRVETFATPAEAVRRPGAEPPDIVLLEPHGGASDVFAEMRALRERHGDQAPPVVWCTSAMPAREQVTAGARLGLRAVMMKPLRLEPLVALVLRVCRDAQRERRLLALGVPASQIASRTLDHDSTRSWARVEGELAPARPLSMVGISSDTAEVMAAVRAKVRAGDMIGRAAEGTLTLLLPEVDEASAQSAARRIARAISALEAHPTVTVVTQRPGADPVALLARHAAERSPAPISGGGARG